MNWRQNWWKLLGVLILCYVIIAGFLIPLKPGIIGIQTTNDSDRLVVQVTGYNTYFEQDISVLKGYLKFDDEHLLTTSQIKTTSDRNLMAVFPKIAALPNGKNIQYASIIIDGPKTGPIIYPESVVVKPDSTAGAAAWSAKPNFHFHDDFSFPYRNILVETIRNTYFHVALWFAMLFLFLAAFVYSIKHLRTQSHQHHLRAYTFTAVGLLIGILGLSTGAIWAKFTWGAFWSWDIKQNMTAIALMIYAAYFVLSQSLTDTDNKGKLLSIYNIFAFIALIPLIYIIPRLSASLHPGAGGNPAFGSEDLDNTMRMVFYPAIIGWTLMGFWIAQLHYRLKRLAHLDYKIIQPNEI